MHHYITASCTHHSPLGSLLCISAILPFSVRSKRDSHDNSMAILKHNSISHTHTRSATPSKLGHLLQKILLYKVWKPCHLCDGRYVLNQYQCYPTCALKTPLFMESSSQQGAPSLCTGTNMLLESLGRGTG